MVLVGRIGHKRALGGSAHGLAHLYLSLIHILAIKRGIDKAVEGLIAELANLAKPTRDQKEIAQIGTISANSDTTIGNIIAEAMSKVGKEGVITVEEAKGLETTMDVVEGCLLYTSRCV